MSNACSFCPVKESTSVSKWLVRGDCVGRRDPPSALCDTYADYGFAASVGIWSPNAPAPFRCNICRALDAAKHREFVAGEHRNRRDPASICRDIFMVCPWMAELRRASPSELRTALVRVKKRLPLSNMSGIEDVLGHGGEVPSDGTSLLLTPAQFSGVRTQAEKVAMESVGRIRLSRAPHVKYKYLLAGAAMRILATSYAPPGKGLAPPSIRPEGLIQTLAVLRTLSRMVKGAARVETPFLRVFDA